MKVELMLAVNDENGNHSGEVDAVEILDWINLEGDSVPCYLSHQNKFLIIDNSLSFDLRGYATWVGNIIWDCAILDSVHVATIINYLRRQHWNCTEAESGLYDKYHSGEEITAEWLEELLTGEPVSQPLEDQRMATLGEAVAPRLPGF